MTEQRKISCIALDLDGTTLRDDKQISAENRRAIEAALAAGVKVVIASGRSLGALPPSVTEIAGIDYAITSNGAAVYRMKDGVCLRRIRLEQRAADEILRMTEGMRLGVETFLNGTSYASREYLEDPIAFGAMPYAVNYIRSTRQPVEDIRAFIREHHGELDGLDLITADEEKKQELQKRLSSAGLPVYITSSVKNRVETVAAEAGKAGGLKFLRELLGIPREETAAFGDGDNDIDMLEEAGIPIAMANASEACRAAAAYVTRSNQEDGVAWGIYEILGIPPRGAKEK